MRRLWLEPTDVDFSDIPAGELMAAALWEYARESDLICLLEARVRRAQRKDPGRISEEVRDVATAAGPNGGILAGMIFNLVFRALHPSEFYPLRKRAWMTIPPDKRNLANLSVSAFPAVSEASNLRNATPWSEGPPDGRVIIVGLRLDYGQGIPAMVDQFKKLVEAHAPPGTSWRRSWGRHGSAELMYRDALNALRALRLCSQHSQAEALKIKPHPGTRRALALGCRAAVTNYHRLLGEDIDEPRSRRGMIERRGEN